MCFLFFVYINSMQGCVLTAHPRLPISVCIPFIVIIRQCITNPVLFGRQWIYSVFGVLLILGVCLSCLPLSFPLATFGLRVSWYVNLQDRELLLDRPVPRSDVFYELFVGALVSLPRLLRAWSPLFPWGCRRYLTALLASPFLAWPSPLFFGSSSLLSPVALFLTFSCSCWPPSPSPFCHALAGFFAAQPVFCSLRGQAVASSAFLQPYLCRWRLRVGWVAASFPWPSVFRRVASLAALCVCRLLTRSLCRLLGRSTHQFLGRSVCRLLGRSVYRLLSHSACRFLGRSVCRLLRCSVCRLLCRSMARSLATLSAAILDAPYVGSLPARPVSSLPARPVASLAAQDGPPSASVFSRLPLPFRGAFFCSFLGLVSPAGHLLTPVFLFSINFFRSRLRVAPSSWALHTSGLTGLGTRAPRVLPPPSGTFWLLETRQYVNTDWRKCRLYICLLKHEIALYTEGTESVCGVVSSTFPRYTLPRSRLFVNLQSDYSAPIHNTI